MHGEHEAHQELAAAFGADDAATVRAILARAPGLRAMINAPVGPFDTPAVVNVRSREMLDVLLDAGADINARSRWWAGGFGILDLVAPELAAYAIERGAVVDAHAASRLGLAAQLRELVESNAEIVHARGGDGQTPLHFACSVDIAEYLLSRGAAIDARDIDHESTPAQYMLGDRQDVARYLVSRGCHTDVLMATALGDLDLVRRHLDAEPGAIRMRVSDDFFRMIGGKAGGSIYQWTLGFYVSALDIARAAGHEEVLALLMERSPVDTRFADACWRGDSEAAAAIRAACPEVASLLTAADRRLVAHAARNNNTAAVRMMLEFGWPVDATSQHDATALHWAAFHGNADMTRAVLAFNPPLDVKDRDHQGTPLGWATHGSEHGWQANTGNYPEPIEALRGAGATSSGGPTWLGGPKW
jgi:ankyrin repeat protein